MSSAIKFSMLNHVFVFLAILFWTCYSEFDRSAHTVALLFVVACFIRSMYFLRRIKVRVPPARSNFEENDPTNVDRPTVLRRRENHLRVV